MSSSSRILADIRQVMHGLSNATDGVYLLSHKRMHKSDIIAYFVPKSGDISQLSPEDRVFVFTIPKKRGKLQLSRRSVQIRDAAGFAREIKEAIAAVHEGASDTMKAKGVESDEGNIYNEEHDPIMVDHIMKEILSRDSDAAVPQLETRYEDNLAFDVSYLASGVRLLDETLPKETRARVPLDSVSFAPENRETGATVLFMANDFMRTNEEETVHIIRPRTRRILDALKIPYELVPPTATTAK